MKSQCNFSTIEDLSRSKPLDEDDFISTRKGLQYLLLKYPNLSVIDAVNDYKFKAYQACLF